MKVVQIVVFSLTLLFNQAFARVGGGSDVEIQRRLESIKSQIAFLESSLPELGAKLDSVGGVVHENSAELNHRILQGACDLTQLPSGLCVLDNNLKVFGNVDIIGSITVYDDIEINVSNEVTVSDSVVLGSGTEFMRSTSVEATMQVHGSAATDDLEVGGDWDVLGNLNMLGDVDMTDGDSTWTVEGNLEIERDLTAEGDTLLTADLNVENGGNAIVHEDVAITFEQEVEIEGDTEVNGLVNAQNVVVEDRLTCTDPDCP